MKAAHLLIVEDEHALALALAATVKHAGATSDIAATAAQARKHLQNADRPYAAMILDIGLPDQNGLEFLDSLGDGFDLPAIVITAHGEIQNTIAARKLGVVEFFQKPLDFDAFHQALERIIQPTASKPNNASESPSDAAAFIGAAASMRAVFQQIAHCCASDDPVLVRGDTGTGKSHSARVIQKNGLRNHDRSVTLVAGPTTSTAELTAAIEQAGQGVLILEEVGLLNPEVQAELVRQIESEPATKFPRLIATSCDDLREHVTTGQFRSDLFYRLQILEVRLPPLRERMDDLPALTAFFLGQLKPGRKVAVSQAVLTQFAAHDWPGNLRELRNALAFALTVSAEAPLIDPSHLPAYLETQAVPAESDTLPAALTREIDGWLDRLFEADEAPNYRALSNTLEAALIEHLLTRYDGKMAPMAAALGANRTTLRRKLQEAES